MRSGPMRAAASSLRVLILLSLSLPLFKGTANSNASIQAETSSVRSAWLPANNLGAFVRKPVNGHAVCVEADVDQAQSIRNPSADGSSMGRSIAVTDLNQTAEADPFVTLGPLLLFCEKM